MATVRKVSWTHNGIKKSAWQVTYTDPATKKRPTKNFKAKKEADTYRLKVEKEIEAGVHTAVARSRTVEEVCAAFLAHMRQRQDEGRLSPERLSHFEVTFRLHLIPKLGGVLLSDLNVSMLEDFYAYLAKRMKPYVARQRIGMVKQVEEFAARREWTKKTVAGIVLQDLRGLEKDEQKRFETEDVLRILRQAQKRRFGTMERTAATLSCFVNIAAFCGLRFGEIRALKPENIDFGAGIIRVRHNLTAGKVLKSTKSKAGIREIPMPSHVAQLIEQWMREHRIDNPLGLVFTTKDATQQGHGPFHDMWHFLLDAVGLKPAEGEDYHHFHALRGFAASWWIDNGVPVTTVAKWLGHSKPDMTLEFYARSLVSKVDQRELADRMARRLLAPAATPLLEAPVSDARRAREESLTH